VRLLRIIYAGTRNQTAVIVENWLMDLSVVIPAYDESTKISADIQAASDFLAANGLEGEIIVVDDGSTDRTAAAAEKTGSEISTAIRLKVLSLPEHRGKGCAVRTGITQSCGDYVMFADSGCCVPYGNALLGLEMLKNQTCEIAHGSRKLLDSDILQAQPRHRRACAALFKWFVNKIVTLPPGLTDTQCGFKLYKGDIARKLYSRCISDGFMFDVEIILRAHKAGYRLKEFPVEWVCDLDSRLSLARTPWPVLSELILIKRQLAKEKRLTVRS